MTHDELLAKIEEIHKSCSAGGSDKDVPKSYKWPCYNLHSMAKALRAVVELANSYQHDSYVNEEFDQGLQTAFRLVIQAIEKELQ